MYCIAIRTVINHSCRFVVLAFDEMKIREDLVFDKVTGEITGFVDYGDESLNVRFNELQEKCKRLNQDKREMATHMMTMMVRGLTFHLNLPIAQFATAGKYHYTCTYNYIFVYEQF